MYKFISDERGVAAAYFALISPILIGVIALSVEVGLWYLNQRTIQLVADLSAISASNAAITDGGNSQSISKGCLSAYNTGLRSTAQTDDCTSQVATKENDSIEILNCGADFCREVSIVRIVPRFFTGYFFPDEPNVKLFAKARAVVQTQVGEFCIAAINQIDVALTLSGGQNLELNLRDCNIGSNTAPKINGSVTIGGNGCVLTTSNEEPSVSQAGCLVTNVTSIPAIKDPFEFEVPSSENATCLKAYGSFGKNQAAETRELCDISANLDLGPVDFLKAVNFSLNTNDNFKIGDWIINEPIIIPGGIYHVEKRISIRAGGQIVTPKTGVDKMNEPITFILAENATIEIVGGGKFGTVDEPIRAPLDGSDLEGVLIHGEAGSIVNITGTTELNTSGLIHLPEGSLNFTGNSGASPDNSLDDYRCLLFLAKNISISGSTTLNVTGSCPFLPKTQFEVYSFARLIV